MSTAAAGYRQDMPPTGGYKNIPYKRVPMKPPLSGLAIFGSWAALTTVGYVYYKMQLRALRRVEVEEIDVNIALEPFLAAENDRLLLNQLRINRDEEKELMKNVAGWKVGYGVDGQPIFKTAPPDFFQKPFINEYYCHSPKLSMNHAWYFFAFH